MKLAESFTPEAALLDLHMPEQSGFDVAVELQRRYGNMCPILIALSEHADAEHQGLAEISGFDDFVAKPYHPSALLELIGALRTRQLG